LRKQKFLIEVPRQSGNNTLYEEGKQLKRFKFLLVALIATISFALCVGDGITAAFAAETVPALVSTKNINVVDGVAEFVCGTATTGGYAYLYGSSACKVVNDHTPFVNITAAITTGGAENIDRILTGEMAMGSVGTPVIYEYYNGNPGEGIEAHSNLRTVYGSAPNPFNFLVRGDSPYKTIEDLKGKKVSIHTPGGSSALLAERILDILGYGIDTEYYNIQYLSPQETCDAMKAGTIDALFQSAAAPHASVSDFFLTAPGGGRFIELSPTQKQKILDATKYMNDALTPAGTYEGQKEDYHTIGSYYAFVVLDDFPDEIAYAFAKALHENYEEWISVFSGVRGATAQITIDTQAAPLHPGTERYFKEIGLLK
jgi:TRAP transporter TAXI family solute receptor